MTLNLCLLKLWLKQNFNSPIGEKSLESIVIDNKPLGDRYIKTFEGHRRLSEVYQGMDSN